MGARIPGANAAVSVVIPSFNGRELLSKNLPPLLAALARGGSPSEVILADDGSTDGSSEWLREEFPQVRVVRSDRREGFQRAVSRGLEAARYGLVYFLNSDVSVRSGFLEPLLCHFEDPRTFAVSSREIARGVGEDAGDRFPTVRFRLGFWWHRYSEIGPRLMRAVPVFFVSMGHGLFRKRMLYELGFLDSRFEPFYFEDQDICFRAWRRGWRCLYEPASVVACEHQATIGRLYSWGRIQHIHWRNRFLFQWKNLVGWRYRLRELFWLPLLAIAAPLSGKWPVTTGLLAACLRQMRIPRAPSATPSGALLPPHRLLAAFGRLPKSRYRILFLHDYAILGGAERSLLLLAGSLDQALFEPVIALAEAGPLHIHLARASVRSVPLDFPSLHPYRFDRWLWHSWRLARWIRTQQIDLVHGNTPRSNLYAWLAGRLAGVPVLWHMRNVLEPGMWDIEAMLRRLPDAILCNSRAVRSRFGEVPADRLNVVYTGVDTEEFRPRAPSERDAARAQLHLGDGRVGVAVVGDIGTKVAHEEFLEAARNVSASRPDARFFIVGSAKFAQHRAMESRLHALVRARGLSDRVRFLGHLDDVGPVMAAMDLLVFPSRFEAFSRALLEAMACALPVVASDTGGILEAVVDGETGRLVRGVDPACLAEGMLELIDDPDKRRRWGAAARLRAKREFSAPQTARRTEEIYVRLLEGF
jgi:glycosyltransferase involved in cell wall biosynthesis/GT2 family glycosyltransferase